MTAPLVIYISGPITGLHDGNFPAFADAALKLRLRYPAARIINPHHNGHPSDACWTLHMRADIKLLMECNAVCLLDGWENSRGAKVERHLGVTLGMDVRTVGMWLA
jgi:hypothetical protein